MSNSRQSSGDDDQQKLPMLQGEDGVAADGTAEAEDSHRWIVIVEGGPAFMTNVIAALRLAAVERRPDSGIRVCFERLAEACERASPEEPNRGV